MSIKLSDFDKKAEQNLSGDRWQEDEERRQAYEQSVATLSNINPNYATDEQKRQYKRALDDVNYNAGYLRGKGLLSGSDLQASQRFTQYSTEAIGKIKYNNYEDYAVASGDRSYLGTLQSQLDNIQNEIRTADNAFEATQKYYQNWYEEANIRDKMNRLNLNYVAANTDPNPDLTYYNMFSDDELMKFRGAIQDRMKNVQTDYVNQAQYDILQKEQQSDENKIKTIDSILKDRERQATYNKWLETMDDPNFDGSYQTTYTGDGTEADVHTAQGWQGYVNEEMAKYGDILYDYINGDKKAKKIVESWDLFGGERYLAEMTDDEKAIFNNLYKQDKTEAYKYAEFLQQDLNLRDRIKREARVEKLSTQHPVMASIDSVVGKLMSPVSAVGNIAQLIRTGEIDQNSWVNQFSYIPTKIRKTVSDNIEQSTGSRLGSNMYNIAMSTADNAARMLLTSGISAGVSQQAAEALTLAMMSTEVFSDTIVNSLDQGKSLEETLSDAIVLTSIELATEQMGLEEMFNFIGGDRSVKQFVKAVFTEGAEEGLSDVLGTYYDVAKALVTGHETEIEETMNKYIAAGYSRAQALHTALSEKLRETGLDVVGGMVSSFAMMGTGTVTVAANDFSTAKVTPTQALIDQGLKYSPESTAYKNAQELSKRNFENAFEERIAKARQINLNNFQEVYETKQAYEAAYEKFSRMSPEQAKVEIGNILFATNEVDGNPQLAVTDAQANGVMYAYTQRFLNEIAEATASTNATVDIADASNVLKFARNKMEQMGISTTLQLKDGSYVDFDNLQFADQNQKDIFQNAKVKFRYTYASNNFINAAQAVNMSAQRFISIYNTVYDKGAQGFTEKAALKAVREALNVKNDGETPIPESVLHTAFEDGQQSRLKTSAVDEAVVKKFAEKFNAKVEFKNGLIGKDGNPKNGEYSDGVIKISRFSQTPMVLTFLHEFTHNMKDFNPTRYNEIKNKLLDFAKDKFGYDSVRDYLMKAYPDLNVESYKNEYKLTDEQQDELVAIVGEQMFASEEFVESMKKSDPELYEWTRRYLFTFANRGDVVSLDRSQIYNMTREDKEFFDNLSKVWFEGMTEREKQEILADEIRESVMDDAQYSAMDLLDQSTDPDDIEYKRLLLENPSEANKFVRDYAKRKGYGVYSFHGTDTFGFTKFIKAKLNSGYAYATDSLRTAETYSAGAGIRDINSTVDTSPDLRPLKETLTNILNDYLEQCAELAGISDSFLNDNKETVDKRVRSLVEGISQFGVKQIELDFHTLIESYADDIYDAGKQETEEIKELRDKAETIFSDLVDEALKYDGDRGVYQFYANTDNFLHIDAMKNNYSMIPLGEHTSDFEEWWKSRMENHADKELPWGFFATEVKNGKRIASTDCIAAYAEERGYDGVQIDNVKDDAGLGKNRATYATDYIFANPTAQLKSADPITYDDNGKIIPLSQRFNPENEDLRYSTMDFDTEGMSEGEIANARAVIKALSNKAFDATILSGYVGMTPDRIKSLIDYSVYGKGRKDASKLYLGWVRPIDFTLATTNILFRSRIKEQSADWTVDSLKRGNRFAETPYLVVYDGNIIGHEGRHRMYGAQNSGVKEVAIVLETGTDYESQPIQRMHLNGQDFNDYDESLGYKKGEGFFVRNIIPISTRYQDVLEKLFSVGETQYSAMDDEYDWFTDAPNVSVLDKVDPSILNLTDVQIEKIAKRLSRLDEKFLGEKNEERFTSEKKLMAEELKRVLAYWKKNKNVDYDALTQIMAEIFLPVVEDVKYTERLLNLSDRWKGTVFIISDTDAKNLLNYENLRELNNDVFNFGIMFQTESSYREMQQQKKKDAVFATEQQEEGKELDKRKISWTARPFDDAWDSESGGSIRGDFLLPEGNDIPERIDMLVNAIFEERAKGTVQAFTGDDAKRVAYNLALRAYEELLQELKVDQADVNRRTKENVAKETAKALAEIREKYQAEWIAKIAEQDAVIASRKAELEEQNQKTKYFNAIKRDMKRLEQKVLNRKKSSHIAPEYMQFVDKIGNAIDITSNRKNSKLNETLRGVAKEYERLAKQSIYATDEYDPTVHDYINSIAETVGNRKINQLTSKEMEKVYKALHAFLSLASQDSRFLDPKIAASINDAGQQTIEDIRKTKRTGDSLSNKFITASLNPLREIKRIVNHNTNDPLYIAAENLILGEIRQQQIKMEISRIYEDMDVRSQKTEEGKARAKEYKKAYESMDREWVTVKMGGVDVEITKAMKLAIIMHAKNPDNVYHILNGGFQVPNKALYKKGKFAEAYDAGVTHLMTMNELIDLKAEEGFEEWFIEKTTYYYEHFSKDLINETSMELEGFARAEVENYYPITVYNRALGVKSYNATTGEVKAESVRSGTLKPRTKSTAEILLNGIQRDVTRSQNFVSRYAGLAVPLRDFWRLYNVKIGNEDSLQKVIANQWGGVTNKYIEQFLENLATGASTSTNESQLLNKIRSKSARAVLTANPSVSMKQFASFPTAIAELDYASVMKALKNLPAKPDYELINKYTPMLWMRMQGMSTQELAEMNLQYKDRFDRFSDKIPWLTNWIQAVDVKTVSMLWYATQNWVDSHYKNDIASGKLEKGSDAYYRLIASKFNDVVFKTQPNYTVMGRPDILRNQGSLTKMLFMFKTQPLQNFGIMYDAGSELIAKRNAYKEAMGTENEGNAESEYRIARKRFARAIGSQVLQTALFTSMTILANLLLHRWDKYEDDETGEFSWAKVAEEFGFGFADSFFGNTIIVDWFEDLGEYALRKYALDEDPMLNGISVFGLDTVNDISDVFMKAVDYFGKGENEKAWKQVRKFAENISQIAGIPAKNIENIFMAGHDYVMDVAEQKAPWDIKDAANPQLINRMLKGEDIEGNIEKLKENAVLEEAAIAEFKSFYADGTDEEQKKILSWLKEYFDFTDDEILAQLNSWSSSLNALYRDANEYEEQMIINRWKEDYKLTDEEITDHIQSIGKNQKDKLIIRYRNGEDVDSILRDKYRFTEDDIELFHIEADPNLSRHEREYQVEQTKARIKMEQTVEEFIADKDSVWDDIVKYNNGEGYDAPVEKGQAGGIMATLWQEHPESYMAIANYAINVLGYKSSNWKTTTKNWSNKDIRQYTTSQLDWDDIGRMGKGNIDLYNRPIYITEANTVETLDSMVVQDGGMYVLIPRIVKKDGKAYRLSDEEAVEYYKDKGDYLGKFTTLNAANDYASKLDEQQSKLY